MNRYVSRLILLSFLLLALGVGCKKKNESDSQGSGPATSANSEGDTTASNGQPSTTSPAEVDTAAEAMHASIVEELKLKHATFENQSWFESRAKIEGDWIAYSPKNYWKKDIHTLPAGYDCKRGGMGCDPQFERKICTSDLDCAASHTQCIPLQASVNKVGGLATAMCLGSGDAMLNDYYLALTKAQKHLEITSLTVPSGRFRQALVNALAILSQRATPPTIRMLFSSLDGFSPNFLNKPDKILDEILKEVTAVGGKADSLKINFGYLSDKKTSWNHAKIVLADSQYLLEGGHNMLDPDYVKEQPIFDLSMHASGSLGIGVQNFVNMLWSKADPVASNLKNSERIVPPVLPDSKEGDIRVIGMGRMGKLGDLASDDGISALLKASKKSIYFAQQDMFNDILKLGPKPSYALPALVDAVLRGVSVKVVQSSSTVFLGYGMVAPDVAQGLLLDAITKEAKARKFVPAGGLTLRQYLCRQVEYAPLLFNSVLSKWPNGDAIGVHPKLIIADETSFYMGSQNFYPADLQEFGLLVSDTKTTGQLLTTFWNPIWEESQPKKVACK